MSMFVFLAWAVGGALCGALTVRVVEGEFARRGANVPKAWASLLLVAAMVYVAFSLWSDAPTAWRLTELLGVALYGALALVGLRHPRLIGLGWLLHVIWDVWLHMDGRPGYVPAWYVPGCTGFDIVVGMRLLLGRWESVSALHASVDRR